MAGRRVRTLVHQIVPHWGAEPIGAAQVESLYALYGSAMAGYGVEVGWGIAGSPERTDTHDFVSPQIFYGASFLGGGGAYVQYPETGLPSTRMPGGLTPFGLG